MASRRIVRDSIAGCKSLPLVFLKKRKKKMEEKEIKINQEVNE
jgi:hypothetical protein